MNDVVADLIKAAGLRPSRVERMEHGLINRHDLIETEDGSRFVARTYRWPFDEPPLSTGTPKRSGCFRCQLDVTPIVYVSD